MGLQRVTVGLKGVTGGHKGLQRLTKRYRGLQGVPGDSKWLQEVTRS